MIPTTSVESTKGMLIRLVQYGLVWSDDFHFMVHVFLVRLNTSNKLENTSVPLLRSGKTLADNAVISNKTPQIFFLKK